MTIIVVKTVINFLFIKYSYIFRISEPVEVPEVFYGPFDCALRLRPSTSPFDFAQGPLRDHSGTAQGSFYLLIFKSVRLEFTTSFAEEF